jgi:hypothetical protein
MIIPSSDDVAAGQVTPGRIVAASMRAVVLIAIALAVCVAKGDSPLPPPSKITATSPSGRIRAISEPTSGTRVEDGNLQKVLWSLPDWHRSIFVADDGEHLVTEYNGLNLIPVDFSDDLVLLTFWRQGKKVREVTVRDLFPDRKGLVRTVSHYAWRQRIDFDASGRLRLLRMDGKTCLFDVSTGNIVKT